MALIGGTFVVVSGVVYFAFMAAWLQVFLLVGVGRAVQVALGAVAELVGLANVKDFVAYGRGFSLSIPQTAKPALCARARRILSAENLAGALSRSPAGSDEPAWISMPRRLPAPQRSRGRRKKVAVTVGCGFVVDRVIPVSIPWVVCPPPGWP